MEGASSLGAKMNWYFNNAGAAEGPHDDAVMTALAREKKIVADSLVWHAGLEAWQTVAALSPSWWAASLPPAGRAVPPTSKKLLPAAPEAGAERRLSGPKAPTADAAEKPQGGGLLKRLFGFVKKKN